MPTLQDNQSLRYPRILCLHGGGTNKRIFRAQCRSLSRALRPYFRLVFAQAAFPAGPGPDVTSVYADYGPFCAWLVQKREEHEDYDNDNDNDRPRQHRREILESILQAIEEDTAAGATGEFIGVLGFSQGARIAASLLLHGQQQTHLFEQSCGQVLLPRWRFGILLAGRGPVETLLSSDDDHDDDAAKPEGTKLERIRIPTAHIHGLQDPNLHLHRAFLHENFLSTTSRVVEWDGHHRVPIKTQDVMVVRDQILELARESGYFVQ
ncbi:hypothetical protein RBB50_007774 [Rhinocladiella similis]